MNASQEFFTTLATLCTSRETGALFAITETDHVMVVGLLKGQIQALRCGGQTGSAVIPLLETVEIKHFSIKPDKSLPTQADLPATLDILNTLSLRIPIDLLAMSLLSTSDTATDMTETTPDNAVSTMPPTAEAAMAAPKTKRTLMYRGQVVEA